MDRQQEAEGASQFSTVSALIGGSPTLLATRTDPVPTPVPPTFLSPEEKQQIFDRILRGATEITICGAAAAYNKIHSDAFDNLIIDTALYVAASCYSGLLFRKLDDLLEVMRGLVRYYTAVSDDFAKHSRELAGAASGQGEFRIVGKGKAGQRDWDGDAAEAEAEAGLLADTAAREMARADSLRQKVKELLDAVRDNLSWYRASRSPIHVGIVDKALHQYEAILEIESEEPTAATTMTTTTTTTTTTMTPPRSVWLGGKPSGLSAEERYETSESGSSRHSSSGSDTVRG